MGNTAATVSLFFVQTDNIDASTVGDVLSEFGFDTLRSVPVDLPADALTGRLLGFHGGITSNTGWRVYVNVDYVPREAGWKGDLRGDVDNARLTQLPEIERFLARRWRQLGRRPSAGPRLLATATTADAIEMLKMLRPDVAATTLSTLRRSEEAMEAPYPVLRELGHYSRYARVCLVDYQGREAVCKIYRPGRERYLKNRLLVADRLAHVPEVTPVLEQGSNWILMPYYGDSVPLKRLPRRLGLLPLSVARRLASVVKVIHNAGIAHLDFHPGHVLADPDGSLHIIDFDRIHVYEQPPPIEENVMLRGYDELMAYDGPTVQWSYDSAWRTLLGMPLHTFLHGSAAEHVGQRSLHLLRKGARRLGGRAWQRLRGSS